MKFSENKVARGVHTMMVGNMVTMHLDSHEVLVNEVDVSLRVDFGHSCCGQLTAVKTRCPLTSIT